MKRCLLLLLLFLVPLCALAEERLALSAESFCGYEENSITVTAPSEGNLLLRITDSYHTYRTLEADVAAGENTIVWDGLAEHEERFMEGTYTLSAELTCLDGQTLTAEIPLAADRCAQALLFALPSSDTLYLDSDTSWFAEIRLVRPGAFVMEICTADAPDAPIATRTQNISGYQVLRYKWNGKVNGKKLAEGEYLLRFYAKSNPAYAKEIPLTILEDKEPDIPLAVTEAFMPQRGDSDEAIWEIMQKPSAVINLKSTSHQKVYDEPSKEGRVLGTLHGKSQAVDVKEIRGDGWVKIGAWNHEDGSYVEGYVPQERLMMVKPNSQYGLLLDKTSQTMTVFYRGQRVGEMRVSTGLVAKNKLIRETPAGSFLTLEHMDAFASEGYKYDYVIRYDGGNLLHQIGYQTVSGKRMFTDHTAQLGQKASHGCIRMPKEADGGLNAYWLWTHLPYHTRLIILDDPEQRVQQAAAASAGTTGKYDHLPQAMQPEALAPGEKEITLTLGGDVVLGTREKWWDDEESLPSYLNAKGYAYPFAKLLSLFERDDMTLVNLECVLKDTSAGEDKDKLYRFRGLENYAAILADASIEQVNLANNHHIDYGEAGKTSTRTALDAAGVHYSGYGYTYVWDVEGLRIGFGGVRETTYKRDRDIIAREICVLKSMGCQVILYSCHWGEEYSPTHNALQEEMARAAVEAGAHVVIGTHPHVVQGVAEMEGSVILYSLGNLMFGGTHDMTTFDGTLARLRLRFDDSGYLGCTVEMIPVLTSSAAAANDFQPVLAEGVDKSRILAKIQADSGLQLQDEMWFAAK